jgi:putative salt-induced outer membrane protein YdiY
VYAAVAHAAAPSFVGADAAGQKFAKPESHLAAELGAAFATGNTQNYSLVASLDGDHRWKRNKLTLDLGANLGQSVLDLNGDGHLDDDERAVGWVETGRKVWVDARYDRYVGKRDSLYLLGGALLDPFAGYDTRTHVQLGYARVLVETPTTRLVAELGADGAREDFVAGVVPALATILAARGMLGLTHAFSANVSVTDTLELYENVLTPVDLRVLNQAALTARLTTKFSLKLSHTLTFDNQPVEGFGPVDQSTVVTFVAAIL